MDFTVVLKNEMIWAKHEESLNEMGYETRNYLDNRGIKIICNREDEATISIEHLEDLLNVVKKYGNIKMRTDGKIELFVDA